MKKGLLAFFLCLYGTGFSQSRYDMVPVKPESEQIKVKQVEVKEDSKQENQEKVVGEKQKSGLSFKSAGVPLIVALSQLFPDYSIELESGVDPQAKVVTTFYSVSPERACYLIARSVDYVCEIENSKSIKIKAYETALLSLPDAVEELSFRSSISVGDANTARTTGGQTGGGSAGATGSSERLELGGSVSKKEFEDVLKEFASEEGILRVDWSSRLVFVKDRPSRVELIRNFLNSHRSALNKSVYLEARLFFFITNSVLETGINWDVLQKGMRGTLNTAIAGPAFSFRFMGNQIEALIQLLSQRGQVDEIISPRVRTTNLVPAQIVRGTNVPYVTFDTTTIAGGGGNTVQTTARIAYAFDGVSLFVRPYVDGDRIYLFLKPLVSRVDGFVNFNDGQGNVIRVPQVSYTSQLTRIELGNDQTVLMGGLVWDGKQRNITGIPLLDQIPLLGRLFSSQRDENRKIYVILAIYGKTEE